MSPCLHFSVLLCLLSISACLGSQTHDEWIHDKSDIQFLAEKGIEIIKKTSSEHLYDDFHILRIKEYHKSISGVYQISLFKLLINSIYLNSGMAETTINIMVTYNSQEGTYDGQCLNPPQMKSYFVQQQQMKYKEQIDVAVEPDELVLFIVSLNKECIV